VAVTPALVQLNRSALDGLPLHSRPRVHTPRAGIVHLGLGAFHRAHQAVYTEDAMAAAGGDWGIVAVAPRSADTVDTLALQDNLFSVTSLDGESASTRVVGALAGVAHLPSQPGEVLALLADPAIRVVTLTVTEKAYLLDPATGRLRVDDPALRADLDTERPPRTIPGLLARGLRAREAAGGPPLAIVSCDNLPSNGARLRGAVQQALDGPLPGWVTFPSTMIDRIVPATTPETLDRAAAALGLRDLAAVAAEPYRQWVLTDEFPGGRPAWERAGAVFTAAVGDYERLKLRVLNGVHSTLAYLGALAGRDTIAEAIELPGMRAYLRRMMTEDVVPTLTAPPGVDLAGYAESVLHRFANPATRHRTLQIAMDGSQKLPQRLFATAAARRAAGAEPALVALALAGWLRFAAGTADDGRELPLDDPLATDLRAALARADGDPAAGVREVFALPAIVSPELAADTELVDLVTEALRRLVCDGAAATVAAVGR
jgi:fructuronate reductase